MEIIHWRRKGNRLRHKENVRKMLTFLTMQETKSMTGADKLEQVKGRQKCMVRKVVEKQPCKKNLLWCVSTTGV